jgi:hypothetical protein
MVKQYWLETLVGIAASFGVIGTVFYLNMTAIHLWWSANWWWVVGIIGLATSKFWAAPLWRGYQALSDHVDVRKIRNQHYLMLAGVTAKMEQGFDTSYKNAPLGFDISVHNPYVKATTKIQEVPAGQIAAPIFPQPRDFAEILSSFMPNENSIFLLDTIQGPITVPMNDVCHVALGGPTGGGKTNTTRLLAAQILACEGLMYMANPNFAPVKLNGQRLEDWRPIAARLQEPPAREIGEIKELLERFMKMFEQRRAQEQISPRRGKDVYLILGEWPAIVARWKEAPQILGMLLRESRQYGIHVISEFQDALISTIGGNSGVRENYRTAYYFGGDLNTAKVLLDLPKGSKIDDTGLGSMGAVYLRSKANAAAPGRVPMFSNRSLYSLLGTPADPVGDDLVLSMDDLPDKFHPHVDGRVVDSKGRDGIEPLYGDFGTRPGEDDEDFFSAHEQHFEKLTTGDLESDENEPAEPAGDSPTNRPYAMMNEVQVAQFCALYPFLGIEKALDAIEGCNHRHRDHARELIERYELRRKKA